MWTRRRTRGAALALALTACVAPAPERGVGAAREPAAGAVFELVRPSGDDAPFTGRAYVYLSKTEPEPRAVQNPARLEPVLAADFERVPAGAPLVLDAANTLAYPAAPAELEGGLYWAQAVLDTRPDAPWPGTAAGNPCSAPVRVELGGGRTPRVRLVCDRLVEEHLPAATRTVRIVDVESARLSAFHGRPVHLRALVHLPAAWFDEPAREFPLHVVLSGYGASLGGFRSVDWPAPPLEGEPFVTLYPDPSGPFGHTAFADGDNNGPVGTAFVEELLPLVEARFRCVGHREGRFLSGHSSGAWAALWLMARFPETFGAAWATSPDPVDFRDFMGVDLYAEDANLLYDGDGRPRPFCMLGGWTVNHFVEHARREEVLRGGVLAFFEALYGGRAADGAPRRLFDRRTGRVDPDVARDWRRYDLSLYLRDHWDRLGPLLDGRLVLTVGDQDNFLLRGSVELLRDELAALGADVEVVTLSGDHFTRLDATRSADRLRAVVERFRAWRDGASTPAAAERAPTPPADAEAGS